MQNILYLNVQKPLEVVLRNVRKAKIQKTVLLAKVFIKTRTPLQSFCKDIADL